MALYPAIHQAVARSRIETRYSAVGVQNGDVGDTAYVGNDPYPVWIGEQRGMKRWHQRRAFTTGGDIAAAEIGHHIDAGTLGNDVGIADLQTERRRAARLMPQRLTMAADGTYFACIHATAAQQRQCCRGKGLANQGVELTEFVQAYALRGFYGVAQAGQQGRGIIIVGRGQHLAAVSGDVHQHGIDAVETGS